MDTLDLIKDIISRDDDQLYLLLGKELAREQLGSRPWNDNEIIRRAEKWLAKNSKEIRSQLIENSSQLRSYLAQGKRKDRILLAAAIADALSGYLTGVTLATVSVLILNEGIDWITEEGDREE